MSAPEALTALFHDYLFDFARVSSFYPGGAPFDWSRLAARARDRSYPDARRAAMAQDLARQNPAPTATLARFASSGSVAVLTGQQVGLFGGPLLGIHKAMTAVLIAEHLRALGVEAVPIFWMASQDHDLAEVNQSWLPDGAGGIPHCLRAEFPPSAAGQPVGSLPLGASITALLDQAEQFCPGDWAAVRAAYHPGATLADAFAALLRDWFAPWGLLVFDPRQSPAAHALWQPFYLQAFDRQPELARRLAERAHALQSSGYHVQVEQTAAAAMLFIERPSGRTGLRHLNDAWFLGDDPTDAAALRRRIADAPGAVSPSALLRPVLQDAVFPTVAHVVGPAETAYLAQSAVLYATLDVPQPIAWPRVRLTLLDARAQRLLQKYDLTLDDLRDTPAEQLLARRALPDGIEQHLDALRSSLSAGLAQLKHDLESLDPTLLDATQGAAQKIEHQLAQLTTRVTRSLARRSSELQAHAHHLEGSLFPNRQPQERVLAAAAFRARDPQLLDQLHASLDPADPRHQLLRL